MLDSRCPLASILDDGSVGGCIDGVDIRSSDVAIPSMSSGKPFAGFDGLDHRLLIKISVQQFGVDDWMGKGIRGSECDTAAYCVL